MNEKDTILIDSALACPVCKGGLRLQDERLTCLKCESKYFIKDGIYCLLPQYTVGPQKSEQKLREAIAREHEKQTTDDILELVAQHHCAPVMSERAGRIRAHFPRDRWIVDVGCGTGYYWRNTRGAKLILMDFALNNLLAAQRVLSGQEDILFVQADASALPLKDRSVSAIWSVQVTQHFPEPVMRQFLRETQRVLKTGARVEIFNLNPSLMHRAVYALCGKKFLIKGVTGDVTINKLNAAELRALWRPVSGGQRVAVGYSELFFHPEFRLRPQGRFMAWMDNLIGKLPLLPSLFARQISIRIDCEDKG